MESPQAENTSTELHSWVKQTQACLERTKPGSDGLIRPDKTKRLNVSVSKDSIQRAMLIWDRILKAIEGAGFRKRLTVEPPTRTVVTVDGEDLGIALREKIARREHVPTPEEGARMRQFKHLRGVPAWDYIPSGKLVMTIEYLNCQNLTVNEVTWSDSEKKLIEDRLDSFADVLVKVAKGIKEALARAEEWERTWAEEERRRQEATRAQAEQKRRIEELERQPASWRLACSIRQFVLAVRDEATRRMGGMEPGSPLDQWTQWAERHAATIDPAGSVLASALPASQGG
jgi:hypothetical protein